MATAKKTTTRKSTATTATKATRTKAATTKTTAKADARIDVRIDVKAVVTDSAYATLGAGDAAIAAARELPKRIEELAKARQERTAAALKDGRTRAEGFVKDVPTLPKSLAESSRKELDAYALRGRKVVESISNAAATQRALSQTETARTQVKGAVTSVRKAVEQGQEALEGAASKIGVRR